MSPLTRPMDVAAIVPAAGIGRRLGTRIQKPFVPLGDRPLLAHTLGALQSSPFIRWIALVVEESQRERATALLKRYRITKALSPCGGGPSRAASVARGFAILPSGARWILVHDGARPCLNQRLIRKAVRLSLRYGAVACGLPAASTVKVADPDARVRLTLKRESLWFVQTPQVFRRDWFAETLRRVDPSGEAFPDDAAMVESAGFPVRMIQGDPLNLKVTTKEDLWLAGAILTK